MASLMIKAQELAVGDVLLLPFDEAEITDIKPIGPKTQFVRIRTRFGWSRVGIDQEVHVKARAL